jgi:uncharacterized membrane protein YbhN (UPF0104 family)
MHHPDPERHRILFRIGLILVVLNFPLHWLGLVVFGIIAAVCKDQRWLWGTAITYAVSWIMLGIGFWLGGRPAYDSARRFWHLRKRRLKLESLRRERSERKGEAQ